MATRQDVLYRRAESMGKGARTWALRWAAALLFGLTASVQAATIQCPLPDARRTITNPLPEGWWTTPIVNRLSDTRVADIGGEQALICEYGNSGSIQRRAPSGQTCRAADRGFTCEAGGASAASACAAALQGKIAWNYEGSKSWNPTNIAQLCRGAENSLEPARCFNRVMHGGISWGGGTKWQWQNAITLCAGSQDAGATIGCFQRGIQVGKPWDKAAEFCSP